MRPLPHCVVQTSDVATDAQRLSGVPVSKWLCQTFKPRSLRPLSRHPKHCAPDEVEDEGDISLSRERS